MRLALGTAQFGLNYGVANTSGQVEPDEVIKILAFARKHGITMLDTAAAYGDSEKVLGGTDLHGFDIVTKVLPFPQDGRPVADWIESTILHSIKRLGQVSIKGILLHRPLDLLGPDGDMAYSTLLNIRNSGLVEKIGVSVYSPAELHDIFSKFCFDIVQAPLNIIDRRLISTGWLDRLKNMGVEVHTRSAFLQGLLLMPASARPSYFIKWEALFELYNAWLRRENLSSLQACLGFLHGVDAIDKVVVGIDSSQQLEQIVAGFTPLPTSVPDFLISSDENLVNPALWRLQ